jgi:hypothetical protein
MSSKDSLEFPTATAQDVAALRESARGARAMTTADYFRFLAQFETSPEALRARRIPPHRERFRL